MFEWLKQRKNKQQPIEPYIEEKQYDDNSITIAMCCDRNWYGYIPTVINSIRKNNKIRRIYLLIQDDYINSLKEEDIIFINMNNDINMKYFEGKDKIGNWSVAACYRCILPDLLTGEDYILYLDTDIICNGDLSKLWTLDMDNTYFAAVAENHSPNNYRGTYYNSGVLFMNLKLMRQNKITQKLLECITTEKLLYPDQDALNLVCRPHIKPLKSIYNASIKSKFSEGDLIRHYIGYNKPWITQDALWRKYKI